MSEDSSQRTEREAAEQAELDRQLNHWFSRVHDAFLTASSRDQQFVFVNALLWFLASFAVRRADEHAHQEAAQMALAVHRWVDFLQANERERASTEPQDAADSTERQVALH